MNVTGRGLCSDSAKKSLQCKQPVQEAALWVPLCYFEIIVYLDFIEKTINNLCIKTCQIPIGVSVAAGVRVGNALGAGNSTAAKRTVKVAISLVGNYRSRI